MAVLGGRIRTDGIVANSGESIWVSGKGRITSHSVTSPGTSGTGKSAKRLGCPRVTALSVEKESCLSTVGVLTQTILDILYSSTAASLEWTSSTERASWIFSTSDWGDSIMCSNSVLSISSNMPVILPARSGSWL